MKRLGDGAHPFTLTLTAQAPPSVQLVPAKRYYGAPIGTSYDVRCFIGKSSLSSTSAPPPSERPLKHRTAAPHRAGTLLPCVACPFRGA